MYSVILGIMILFLTIAICKAFTKKDFMHPLVMYIFPFFIQYLVFYILLDEYSAVSQGTLMLYIFSITLYIVGYLMMETIISRVIICNKFRKLPLNSKSYFVYRIITVIGVVSILYEIIKYGIGTEAANIYDAMAIHIDWGGGYNVFAKYIPFFYGVVLSFFVYNYDYGTKDRREKKRFIWAVIVAYAFAIASFSRTSIMLQTIVLVYIVLYRNKKMIFRNTNKIIKSINKILVGIVFLLIGFSIIAKLTNKLGTGGLFSKDFYLWDYFSAQIRTLDKYVIKYPGISNYFYIGGVFSKLLGKSQDFRTYLPTINEFNVFSYIGSVYLDCGNLAYIFHAVLGAFVAFIYNMNMKKGGYWTIFYAYYSYAIFMSFYAYQYSLTIYIYIVIIFFLIRFINTLRIRT